MYLCSGGLGDVNQVHIVTGHIHRPQYLSNGDIYEYMNVVSGNCTHAEIQAKFQRQEKVDPQTEMFLAQLAPKDGTKVTLMSSVALFEGLIQNVHKDLEIIRAIASLDKDLFKLKPCQAIVQYCWGHSRKHAIMELLCHTAFMMNFLAIGVILRPPNPEEQGWYVTVLASGGGFIWVFEFLNELLQMLSYKIHGWLRDYLSSFGSYVDWFRLGGDACVLYFLWLRGLGATENGLFLVTFGLCAFYKWIMILYALTSFRAFGLSIIPILHTMLDIGPFFTVLMFFMFGLVHGYTALCVPGISIAESGLIVYRLGLLGDIDVEELDGGNDGYWYVTRIFFVVVSFSVTVTLMNTFIAALGNSFNNASSKMEVLFQSHRADRVLGFMAVSHSVDKLLGRARLSAGQSHSAGEKASLWFCCAAERDH